MKRDRRAAAVVVVAVFVSYLIGAAQQPKAGSDPVPAQRCTLEQAVAGRLTNPSLTPGLQSVWTSSFW